MRKWHRWAISFLRDNNSLRAIPCDKDGVFCIISASLDDKLVEDKLDPKYYWPILGQGIPFRSIMRETSCIAVKLGKAFESVSITRKIMQTFRDSGPNSLICTLNHQIQTHKPPGQISDRLLHASPQHPLRALAKFVQVILLQQSRTLGHLCESTNDLLEKIKHVELSSSDPRPRVARFDVVNFFMEGSFEELSDGLFLDQPPQRRSALQHAVQHLLVHQYVESPELQQCFQVLRGGGMGMMISGEISDLCYYRKVERSFACVPSVQRRFGISSYLRYRDDVVVVYDSTPLFCQFLQLYRQKLAPTYQVTFEGVSFDSIPMLDLSLGRIGRWRSTGRMGYEPYFKPTSRPIPLAICSGHHPKVHSWPHGYLHAIASHSSSHGGFLAAREYIVNRYASQGLCS